MKRRNCSRKIGVQLLVLRVALAVRAKRILASVIATVGMTGVLATVALHAVALHAVALHAVAFHRRMSLGQAVVPFFSVPLHPAAFDGWMPFRQAFASSLIVPSRAFLGIALALLPARSLVMVVVHRAR